MYLNIGRASPMNRLLRSGFLVAVLLPGVVLAAQPVGTWTGVVQQANTDASVDASFKTGTVELRFGVKLSCAVTAKFLKDSGTASVYRFGVSTNGGNFCDGLLGKDLTVTPTGTGHLSITFPSAKTEWKGDLSQPTATP
jgi:predicted hotdog family 3-hydroxylacyl-ACP dehydratase